MIQLFYGGSSFKACRSVSGYVAVVYWTHCFWVNELWILVLSLPLRFLSVLLVKLVFALVVSSANRKYLLYVPFGVACTCTLRRELGAANLYFLYKLVLI